MCHHGNDATEHDLDGTVIERCRWGCEDRFKRVHSSNIARNYAHEVLNRARNMRLQTLNGPQYDAIVADFEHMYVSEGHSSPHDAWTVYYDRIGGWKNFEPYARCLTVAA